MKRRRGTIELAALAAGVPAAKARRIGVLMLDPAGGPGEFVTSEELMIRAELADLARLRWLLNLAQGAPINEAEIAAEVAAVVRPYQDGSSGSRPASGREVLRFVSKFVSDLKRFIEKRGTGIKWKIAIGKVSRSLSWEDILTGGSRCLALDWRNAFLLWATELIDLHGNRIRRCSNGDCGRLFVGDRIGRQKFCSPECGATERQRRFRAKVPDWPDYRRRGRQRREEVRRGKETWKANLKTGREQRR